jgi:prevent-host-death family protein
MLRRVSNRLAFSKGNIAILTLTVDECKARLDEIIALVESGETVEVTRNGRVIAKITPIPRPEPPREP